MSKLIITIFITLIGVGSFAAGGVVASTVNDAHEPIVTVRSAVGVGSETAFYGEPVVTVESSTGVPTHNS